MTSEFGERLEDERPELNVAGGGTTGELDELDDGLVSIAMGSGKTDKLGKLGGDKLELAAVTGGTTDKSDVAGGECWLSSSV